MNKADCFNLGHVAKLHGYKGEVSLFFDVTDPKKYHSLDAVYIDINDQLTPFFVESLKPRDKGFATVKFEGVDSDNDAKVLQRKDLYLPIEVLPDLTGTDFYDHEVIGFTVHDETHGEVGELQQIIDLSANPLIQIDANGTEVLIPLNKEMIIKVDREKEELHLKAPEGLISLYLD